MPSLKKIISNIKLGREHRDEAASVEEQPGLKRANARLRKRNRSNTNVLNGLGVVRANVPIREEGLKSRTNSFETGQSVLDFEAEIQASASRPTKKHSIGLRHRQAGDGSLVSRLGLKVNTVSSPILNAGEPSSTDLPIQNNDPQTQETNRNTLGLYNLEAHPENLAKSFKYLPSRTPLSRSETVLTDGNPYEDALLASEGWSIVSGGRRSAPSELQEAESSAAHRRSNLPPIRDIDWSKMSEVEATRIAKAYDEIANPNMLSVSPSDSAVEFQEADRSRPYSGKGKRPQSCRGPESVRRAAAADFWGVRKSHPPADRYKTPPEELEKQRDLAEQQFLARYPRVQELEQWRLQNEPRSRARENQIQRQSQETMADMVQRQQLEGDRMRAQEIEKQLRKEQDEEDRLRAQAIADQLRKEQEEEERLAVERARLRDCNVCGDTKDPLEFPAKAPTSGCAHASTTCNDCLQSWMASEFETKGCEGINCPECSQTLEYNEVQAAASTETFEAFDKLATRLALGSLDDFGWCLKPGCNSGQLNIENNNYMDCANCGYKQCLRDKVPWHANETCDQYEYRTSGQKARDEERQTEAMLDTISKKCPGKTCQWRIQKIDGCAHMTCKRCKHEFCWECLASHSEIKRLGNTAHALTCKFHSNNLELTWPFNYH